jgi:hypothetical protein
MDKKKVISVVLSLIALVGFAYGANEQFAYSPANFFVSTSLAFSVYLLGEGATTSTGTAPGGATGAMYFNSTTSTASAINPCTDLALETCQTYALPILNFTNTGTSAENLSIKLNESLETGLSLWWNSSCSGTGCGGTATAAQLGAGWTVFANALPWAANNWAKLWLYANFSTVSAGAYPHWFLYNSSTT